MGQVEDLDKQYTRTMPDFSAERFQSSLADTVAWCKLKAIVMDADADDVGKRHALYAQAGLDWEQAQETAKQGWLRRKIAETIQWQNAMALLNQIRDSLGRELGTTCFPRRRSNRNLRKSRSVHPLGNMELNVVQILFERRFYPQPPVKGTLCPGWLLLGEPT